MRARPSSGSMFGEGSVLVNLGRKRRGLLEDAEKDGITWPRGVNIEKSCMCYTVCPYRLSILNIAVSTCLSQTP